jgi:lysozyme
MITSKSLDLVKHFEGCKLSAYKCPAGVWTIGYGHTAGVKQGDTCTQMQADLWLKNELSAQERTINEFVTVKITQNQRYALASFIYNVGPGAFKNSTLARKLNNGDYTGAAAEFSKWTKAGGKTLPGLISRRAAERALFESKTA